MSAKGSDPDDKATYQLMKYGSKCKDAIADDARLGKIKFVNNRGKFGVIDIIKQDNRCHIMKIINH